ncbi:FAD-dependent oxidoreductase [Gemmatimonadota bacterium]
MSTLRLTIGEKQVEVVPGTSLLQAAREADIYIPSLCDHPDLPPWQDLDEWPEVFQGEHRIEGDQTADRPEPGCGLCVVVVDGIDAPVRACTTAAADGMLVRVEGEDLRILRQQRLGEIFTHHPHTCLTCAQKVGCSREPCSSDVPVDERCCPLLGNCELERVADHVGIPADALRYRPENLLRVTDEPLFDRDFNLCIACTRCVRACRDLRGVDVIGLTFDEGRYRIGTRAPSLIDSECRFCTACVEVCPTGALRDRNVPAGSREETLVACRTGCPAHTDVPVYVGLAAEGRLAESAAVVRERAPLVHVLGHICFHPCESVCRRGEVNDSVAIRAVKRTAAEHDDGRWKEAYPRPEPTGKKVAVIGAGPAGITASYFLNAAGHAVTLFDREEGVGGMLRSAIPAFRLPRDDLEQEVADIIGLGIEVRSGFELGRDGSIDDLLDDGFNALLLATGAGKSKRIPLPGSDLNGVWWGLEFLRESCLGSPQELSGCCVVVGGGNVAMDVARSAWRLGADSVDLLCLESEEEIPAYASEIAEAVEEGVRIHYRWGPAEVTGEGGVVSGIVFRRCLSVSDDEGRFAPVYDDDDTCSFPAENVILAIGQEVESVEGDPDQTGLFRAGDFLTGPASVIEAIASGRGAAEEIDIFLGGSGDLSLRLVERDPKPSHLGREEGFAGLRRFDVPLLPSDQRRSFSCLSLGLDAEASRAEGSRCLRCDLRLDITPVTLPPRLWLEFTPDQVAKVPSEPGAYQLLDGTGKVLAVVGVPDLKAALVKKVDDPGDAIHFLYQEDPMYTRLESELLQQCLQQQGEMPGGALDDLDDLF